jgi:rod shape determining protein RodA
MNQRFLLKKQSKTLRKLGHLPFLLIFLIMAISLIGFIMMFSAAQGEIHPWASKQILHFLVFFPLMIIIAIVDIKIWYRLAYLSYFMVIILLILIEVFGHTAMGATRWIDLGFIKLQPSELMKICLVFALARYFHTISYNNIRKIFYLIPPLIITLIPFLLILKQPDLGTAMILLMAAGMMFFATGVLLWKFAAIILAAGGILPFAWHFMHDYQKKRIITFIDPESDPLGAGYNIIQSKIAIGSGGFFGKGLLKGSQSQLDFLPEHQTDFIFTMMAEELGFARCITVLILYAFLIIYGIYISVNCRNHFGRMMAIGIVSVFFLHVFVNMAMVMGLLPVVGVPLPLLSYGGTIMMTILIGFGLIMNVSIHSNANISANTREIL